MDNFRSVNGDGDERTRLVAEFCDAGAEAERALWPFMRDIMQEELGEPWARFLPHDPPLSLAEMLRLLHKQWVAIFSWSALGSKATGAREASETLFRNLRAFERLNPPSDVAQLRQLSASLSTLGRAALHSRSTSQRRAPPAAAAASPLNARNGAAAARSSPRRGSATTRSMEELRSPGREDMTMDVDDDRPRPAESPPIGMHSVQLAASPSPPRLRTKATLLAAPMDGTFNGTSVPGLFVVDGPNVAYRHGVTAFSARGIVCAHRFLTRNGYRCVTCIPDGPLKRQMLEVSEHAMVADEDDVLVQLREYLMRGDVLLTPHGEYDDSYVLGYAMSHGGVVVSNDHFSDHLLQAKARGSEYYALLREYLTQCRLGFAFRADEFIPSPDFDLPHALALAAHTAQRYADVCRRSGGLVAR